MDREKLKALVILWVAAASLIVLAGMMVSWCSRTQNELYKECRSHGLSPKYCAQVLR